jgi:hypothetical protein
MAKLIAKFLFHIRVSGAIARSDNATFVVRRRDVFINAIVALD